MIFIYFLALISAALAAVPPSETYYGQLCPFLYDGCTKIPPLEPECVSIPMNICYASTSKYVSMYGIAFYEPTNNTVVYQRFLDPECKQKDSDWLTTSTSGTSGECIGPFVHIFGIGGYAKIKISKEPFPVVPPSNAGTPAGVAGHSIVAKPTKTIFDSEAGTEYVDAQNSVGNTVTIATTLFVTHTTTYTTTVIQSCPACVTDPLVDDMRSDNPDSFSEPAVRQPPPEKHYGTICIHDDTKCEVTSQRKCSDFVFDECIQLNIDNKASWAIVTLTNMVKFVVTRFQDQYCKQEYTHWTGTSSSSGKPHDNCFGPVGKNANDKLKFANVLVTCNAEHDVSIAKSNMQNIYHTTTNIKKLAKF